MAMFQSRMYFAALLALVMLTCACNGSSPTAPTPTSQPGPPVVVVPPALQEVLIASNAFKMDPCVTADCHFRGIGAYIPALGKGRLRVSVTLLEPQATLRIILWNDDTISRQILLSQIITTAQDPADKDLGQGSKGEVVFDQYDGEARFLTVTNVSPIPLTGGRTIVYIKGS